MDPPPMTPSPHRFVIKKHPRPVASSEQPSPLSSVPQFNSTPRFSFLPSQQVNHQAAHNVPSATALYSHLTPARVQDSIEDAWEDLNHDVHESIETAQAGDENIFAKSENSESDLDIPRPKRRRLAFSPTSSQYAGEIAQEKGISHVHNQSNDRENGKYEGYWEETLSSSPPKTVSSLPAPRTSTHTPRFVLPSTPARVCFNISTPGQTTDAFLKPPRFRPVEGQELGQQATEPLPEAFSPHRRGQKFLTGGLAAEVRGWLVDLETIAAPTSAKVNGDPWACKLVVDDVRGGPGAGMTLVRGRQTHLARNILPDDLIVVFPGVVKMILGGEVGMTKGLQYGRGAEIGVTIGVKGPVWEVILGEERWNVGANWEMITKALCEALDAEERKSWHSHDYEVCSGMLIMPNSNIPNAVWEVAETEEMKAVVGLYGKTYNFWQVDRGDTMPLGKPELMMSFTKYEQVQPLQHLQY